MRLFKIFVYVHVWLRLFWCDLVCIHKQHDIEYLIISITVFRCAFVLMFQCCTLEHPFEARNQCALIMKIIQSPVKPPPSTSVSAEMINLVLWLLQKDPNNRPSIKDLLHEAILLTFYRLVMSSYDAYYFFFDVEFNFVLFYINLFSAILFE
jgi:serine/threonine protein kinase